MFSSYPEALAWVQRFTDYERIALTSATRMHRNLDGIRQLLTRLGEPQSGFRSLHVAGTNGKGSCVAMAAEILSESEGPVGLYVSPHLETIRERIAVGGVPVSEAEVLDLLNRIVPHLRSFQPGEPGAPTFFDIMTSAAFLHFRDRGVRFACVETGLGGRLDSTNVLRAEAGILTNVGRDHVTVLGETLESIAREKAGIVKAGMAFSCDLRGSAAVAEVVEGACRAVGIAPLRLGREIAVELEAPRSGEDSRFLFAVRCPGSLYRDLELQVLGGHQRENAALVVGVLDALRLRGSISFEPGAARRGLARFRIPGRIERIPGDPPLVLDGAHNPSAIGVLRRTLDEEFPGRAGLFVFGIARDKEWDRVLADLLRPGDAVIATRADNPRFLDPEEIAGAVGRLGLSARVERDPFAAVRAALDEGAGAHFVCVTGSFYLVGELRPRILEWRAWGPGAAAATPIAAE